MFCDKERQVNLGRYLQDQLLSLVVNSPISINTKSILFSYVFCYIYIHVFQCLVDSLNRVIELFYVDVVDPWLVLVACASYNYSNRSYDLSIQARRKVKLAIDSK